MTVWRTGIIRSWDTKCVCDVTVQTYKVLWHWLGKNREIIRDVVSQKDIWMVGSTDDVSGLYRTIRNFIAIYTASIEITVSAKLRLLFTCRGGSVHLASFYSVFLRSDLILYPSLHNVHFHRISSLSTYVSIKRNKFGFWTWSFTVHLGHYIQQCMGKQKSNIEMCNIN